ncbi:tryptophan 7-halogenase [Colwellia sp. 1_MG-2023]|uniref:tryptophan halogenase family protein n=1 Tax=Colwellia sp. 1_MG-2023 TaxID=3062649 RepID=UPI0026E22837|nr:tryptophan halogenase family protein [Colwellia sp. 1_MG-2023]MDO6447111.1 tryptophan 7-halogenase [Colwellia sp. 1_MG-2023]
MNNKHKKVKSIVIAGGGTSGWMTAAALSKHFDDKSVDITLVESSQIGTIGVGEATIPTLRRFYGKLGLTDLDVIKATAATCKLGIEFKDWYKKGTSFIHPFGIYGQGTQEVPFHHYWLKDKASGGTSSLADYSLGVKLAQESRFTLPSGKPESQLEIFDWALHFDAALFADLMREYSLNHGVSIIDNKIANVKLSDDGSISSLIFEDDTEVEADLFIDCTGFKSLLTKKALKVAFEDWSQWLVCDRAVAVQSETVGEPLARTVSQAHEAGWQWKIPLQHRMGNGMVYSSQYIDDESAEQCLLTNLEGKPLHAPRKFSFTPGRVKQAWNKNCIAVGLSSGFLEPLESTSIALVETAIEKIIMSFKQPEYNQQTIDKFNEVTVLEYERVRDFIILHYKANQRTDAPMWEFCRNMALPEKLTEKLAAYQSRGDILQYPWEIFGKDSWLAIFDGFKIYPDSYDKRADSMELAYLQKNLNYMKERVKSSVDAAPTHGEFLRKHCHFIPKS